MFLKNITPALANKRSAFSSHIEICYFL